MVSVVWKYSSIKLLPEWRFAIPPLSAFFRPCYRRPKEPFGSQSYLNSERTTIQAVRGMIGNALRWLHIRIVFRRESIAGTLTCWLMLSQLETCRAKI
jgi:hypothetical protein